ncbi:MarR family transcriptional regulator [Heyndrickxia sporothermodurans]|uniref:helix-turn-helix domain-containing protein n=2 Tax=Bacillales TaxID=1385 RepID=UPI002449D83C|nr:MULTISPECIES: helix-turn-helix domain-containing protein [Bacillaceae]MDH2874526.1 MarR family transcriptional regulator [Bacillus cytotoxicus]MDH2886524.1 MarR family transcriptional regulator [Bacillus cytotoxicus]MDH2890472.1 MarR family transcriptional regulator [Bacillus cytotoxicus]MEB6551474.1 MarR family transcriptional regulator [Heyndrickxia sporothermodurans]HDR7210891.1 MarR family transcriptional regulator [Bacillus cytotoxicus]
MAKVVDFNEAEKKARKRDFDLEKLQYALDHGGIPQDQLENAMELLSKATGKDLYIGTKRSPQSKVRFAQSLQENLGFLNANGYLTNKEKVFLSDITPFIAFSSNCIVHDIKAKNPVPANVSEIAKLIGISRQNTSLAINSLVKKGLLFKGESGVEGNNAKAYAVFVNPHVIYAGDKDSVNEALQVMFHKAMKMPILKDLPDKLF